MTGVHDIRLPAPQLQVDFAFTLSQMRSLYLLDALKRTVEGMEIADIDRQLAAYVPNRAMAVLARQGLRGELAFAVPCLLEREPRLIAYYRLLLGYSRKEFYTAHAGTSRLRVMEDSGMLPPSCADLLPGLSKALIGAACFLVDGIASDSLSLALLDDLTLLTLGPQLRGAQNVRRGGLGIAQVFEVILTIVKEHAVGVDPRRIEIRNSAGRSVIVEFTADPDITIREQMSRESFRNIVAIEVKAGQDYSNIHNRLGEAEKSHRKAAQAGYTEFWTVTNVPRLDQRTARRETPTTNRFYSLSELMAREGAQFDDFRNRIIGLTGIPDPPTSTE